MNPLRSSGRWARGLVALAVTATSTLAALTAMADPAAATGHPKPATTADQPKLGDACTSADLGKRYPFIKSSQVQPTITHFKGWYVTEGSTGSQTIETSTQTVVTVQVGLSANIEGSFKVDVLGQVGASLGLTVQMSSSTTSSQSKSITWDFRAPGYYGIYEGTRKVSGQYGSLNCNRVDQGNGTYATKWIEGPEGGSFTTYTTLEEGAVRCEDKVPANSIMRKAQDLLDCQSAAAGAGHAPGPAPSARDAAAKATDNAATARTNGPSMRAGFTCDPGYYKIGTPDRALFWTAPLLPNDSVRLRPSTVLSGNLDQWQLCHGPEHNGVAEQILVNHRSNQCLAVAEQNAAAEGSPLVQADCKTDDLQRFYVYRDVPGSDKIGVQNKYTGSMVGHDRYADGQPLRQYSTGKPDGTGTYVLVKA
ncbi:RICIN domain-containing protein [Streptomyces sp. NPDC048595]|uniref:RICIN domain-containing protein n=1 Tax=Streptomyces sp. NPDC048595 TaxID=3365576 RepID=UPI00371A9187